MTFSSTKDINLSIQNLKIYALGDFGTGKSVFASTFPTPGFLFDFDQRATTYRGKEWDYRSYPMSAAGWVQFESDIREVQKLVKEGKYKTVVVDSTTSMTDTAMERALMLDPKRSPEGGPIWNVHYQMVRNLMEPRLHAILSMPCHVVMIGHWKITTDAKTGIVLSVDPLLTGALAEKVPGYFDEVYAFFTKMVEGKERFYFRTVTQGFYRARSTISGPRRLLPDEIPNNYDDLLKHLESALDKERKSKDGAEKK